MMRKSNNIFRILHLLLVLLSSNSYYMTDAFSSLKISSSTTSSSLFYYRQRSSSAVTTTAGSSVGRASLIASSLQNFCDDDDNNVNEGVVVGENNNNIDNRRSLLFRGVVAAASAVATTTMTNPTLLPANAAAAGSQQVRGPIELLRPATRVKLYIDEAITICQTIKSSDATGNNVDGEATTTNKLFQPIVDYLLEGEPISWLTLEEEQLSKRYLEIDTSSAWQAARLKEREARGAEIGVDYTTPYDRFNTAVQQWGDKRTFQILRQRQRGLEQTNGIRAAFNAYTNNLVFGDSYQLNVQGDAKKSLVRNDALPNVNAVVVSDLDLRDLYRNQILQNIDDAKAEVTFQLKSKEYDIEEVLTYLKEAQTSCNEWFSFIPQSDVEEALQAVRAEKKDNNS